MAADFARVMGELKALGSAQNRKVYPRHGAPEPLFGVSFANQGKLARRLGTDHALATRLWESGNADARYLATRLADPAAMGAAELDRWARSLTHYVEMELMARHLVSRSPLARARIDRWTRARGEWVSSLGWATLASLALGNGAGFKKADWLAYLARIEHEIGNAPNRTRHEMNGALIAIGGRDDTLAQRASAVARRIGPVAVDHGQTGCKTPEAVGYIERMRKHARRKQR